MYILAELEKIGAVFTDKHFVYASGKHGSAYINLDLLFPHTQMVAKLCADLAKPFAGEFDTVAAPATGGIVLSVLTANVSGTQGIWADKADGGFVFERAGFVEAVRGKRVLVVEDLLTTGGSVDKVCREVEKVGGTVVGVSVVCNRGGVTAEALSVPRLTALAEVRFSAYDPGECIACQQQQPIVEDMGHGDDYKAEHPDYAGGYERLQAV
ncbi:phosphoribosyltransferase [Candidatus Saccharibacteria bacterium]|nr:phosphoribosyltransferase [Candidatus Saccharibacteria bacterium]